jgi:hypothetical protein
MGGGESSVIAWAPHRLRAAVRRSFLPPSLDRFNVF